MESGVMNSGHYPAIRGPRKPGLIWSSRLSILLTAASLLLLTMGVLAARSQNAFSNANTWLVRTEQVRTQLARVLQVVSDVETGARGYALTGNRDFLAPFTAAMPALPQELAALKRLTADNATQQTLAARLEGAARERAAFAAQLVEFTARNDLSAARIRSLTAAGKGSMDEVTGE